MVDGPIGFRIQVRIQVRAFGINDFRNVELVEAQKPVSLVKPMFPIQLHGRGLRKPLIIRYRQICAEEHALQSQRLIQRLRKIQYLKVRLGGCPDDHLRRLACGHVGALPVGRPR